MKTTILGIIIIVIIVVAGVLLAPIALAGSFNVRVTQVSFVENNSGTRITFSSNLTAFSTTTRTALEYYYSNHSGGRISTTPINVNSTKGSTNTTFTWRLNNPSNATVAQGNYTYSGGLGNRTYTFTFSVDQGVKTSGTYLLFIFETAATLVSPSTSVHKLAQDAQYSWNVP